MIDMQKPTVQTFNVEEYPFKPASTAEQVVTTNPMSSAMKSNDQSRNQRTFQSNHSHVVSTNANE